MRLLHTSDWHIGRTFHTHSTLEHFRQVVDAIARIVESEKIDVVLVSGDVFDSAVPAAESYLALSDALRAIRGAGARIVLTSGNHDSATRLGFQSEWVGESGIHVLTSHDRVDPVTIDDEFGPVHIYGIPFLEPALIRHHYPEVPLRTHEQALRFAMDRVRADMAVRAETAVRATTSAQSRRSIVMSHCFAAGFEAMVDTDGPERDITAGGLDLVPVGVFDGPDYVALGHIHGRATISDRARYSGAPLHYSFSEAGKPRGGWIVQLDASGLESVDWIDFPVPRALSEIRGTLAELLSDPVHQSSEHEWVKATITDAVRPLDGMRRLQQRFPHCVALEYRPAIVTDHGSASYSQRIEQQTDLEIVDGFLGFVRNGHHATDFETALVTAAFSGPEARP